MKRVGFIFCLGLICVVLMAGCGKKNSYEKFMKKYATDYYNNFQKDIPIGDTDEYYAQVSIEMLEKANEDGKYNMSKLEKCSKESLVNMKINLSSKEIENYQFDMKCE